MKKIIYIVTSITILIIAGVVFYFAAFKKQFDPKPIIDEMAQTYYKEVIYPDNLRKYGEEYSEKMEELKEIKKSLFTIMEKVEHPDRYKFKKPDEFNIELKEMICSGK